MNKQTLGALFLISMLMPACSGSAVGPVLGTRANFATRFSSSSGAVHGNFTEYPLPSGAFPTVFTKGPYSTLWFGQNTGNFGNGYNLYRFAESNGTVTTFSQSSPWSIVSSVLTTNDAMYFIALNTNGPGQNPEYLSWANSSGAITTGPQIASDEQIGTLVLGADGNLWFPDCVEACTAYASGNYVRSVTTAGASAVDVQLPDFNANQMTPGPLGYMYVTASYTKGAPPPPPPQPNSAVFVLSSAGNGQIVDRFVLPRGSRPNGIATGADHNLWITEPGINKIARMTPSGTITQFNVPTQNAGAAWITGGADGALWFTETNADKLGRITTSGTIREWRIPTANSGASAIQYCYPGCGPHYGVWFAETKANQIAKFDSPI